MNHTRATVRPCRRRCLHPLLAYSRAKAPLLSSVRLALPVILVFLLSGALALSGCGGGTTVTPGSPGATGSATLAWDAPDTNVDGTPLTNLGGFKVYYGTAPGSYTSVVTVGLNTSCEIGSLAQGKKYFFAVTAYDSYGNESGYSNEVSKDIPVL